jgi:hypothetical protein
VVWRGSVRGVSDGGIIGDNMGDAAEGGGTAEEGDHTLTSMQFAA